MGANPAIKHSAYTRSRVALALIMVLLLPTIAACQNASKKDIGAVGGMAAGAAAGAAACKGSNCGLAVILGALIGGVAGAVIGHQLDEADRLKAEAAAKQV